MFAPINVGTAGRRAVAWFVRNGVVCSATDANAAAHAIAVVIEALAKTERSEDTTHLLRMAESLVMRFPQQPGEYHAQSEGQVNVDIEREGIGYGYVRPAANAFECGGALFGGVKRTVHVIGPYAVLLFDADDRRD